MMNRYFRQIETTLVTGQKLMAVLLDPDKMRLDDVPQFISKVNDSIITHVFVGGSEVEDSKTSTLVATIKHHTVLPIFLFPGDVNQITEKADALLFLSLISGRNPDYLIGKHVEAVSILKHTDLEVIPTGYLLIENGKQTSVERVSNTSPLKRQHIQQIIDTAKAGEYLGMKLIYLEAGSGATDPIDDEIIQEVKKALSIPLIVGGGIRSIEQLQKAYDAGADMVVIGTAFEEDEILFSKLNKRNENIS